MISLRRTIFGERKVGILETFQKNSSHPTTVPSLFKLWKAVSANIWQNLISGFKATGLYPSDPTQALKRIKRRLSGLSRDTEAIGRNLDSSLIDLLREHRGIGSESQKRKKGKKLQPRKNLARETQALEPGDSRTPKARDYPTPFNEDSGNIDKLVSMSEVASTSGLSLPALKSARVASRKTHKTKEKQRCETCRIHWKDWKSPIDRNVHLVYRVYIIFVHLVYYSLYCFRSFSL